MPLRHRIALSKFFGKLTQSLSYKDRLIYFDN